MDGLTLLDQARRAGLTVAVEGDRLRIRGPRAADAVARRLLADKPNVLAELRRLGAVAVYPVAPGFAGPFCTDSAVIPGSCFPIDPLYRGVIDGEVLAGWTLEGHLAQRRDQMRRTDDPLMRARLQADIDAILANERTKKT